jgi:hypothetical protein
MADCAGPGWPTGRQALVDVTTLAGSTPATQSLSLAAVHPGAQQPSAFVHTVIAAYAQRALQLAALPVTASLVQVRPSEAHVVGHEAPSHSSPDSTTPLPQIGAQSLSLVALAPDGQQLSPFEAATIGVFRQVREQPVP